MKKLLIGFVVGILLGFVASKFFPNTEIDNSKKNNVALEQDIAKPERSSQSELKLKEQETVNNSLDESKSASKIITTASQPQTIEEYQVAYAQLQQAIIQQSKTVQKLTAENKKLTNDLENGNERRTELPDLSIDDISKAKANIEASLVDAPQEYAEVLKSALDSYNSGDALPDADALLRHYSDEPDFAWSDIARVYIQNYFSAQTDSNIQLVQLNCRKTYCELYGFYSNGEQLDNPRQAGSQIQAVFNAMEKAPGFANLFIGLESASISVDSENSYMTFHNFIRSNQR